MSETQQEFCVILPRRDLEPHRGPYDTRGKAEDWIKEAEDDGFKPGVFKIAVREVSDWRLDD